MSGFYVRYSHAQIAGAVLLLLGGTSVYLLSVGEVVACVVWSMIMGLLLPAFLLSRVVNSFVLQLFVAIAFVSQVLSVPLFMVNRDRYTHVGWRAVKDFSFTVAEFIDVYSRIALFLFVVVVWGAVLMKGGGPFRIPGRGGGDEPFLPMTLDSRRPNTGVYLVLLCIVAAMLVPLHLWMFRNGISLTGVTPPKLPFKLSGALHYFAKYIVPLTLAVIYARTSRSYLPAIVLLTYAFVSGASQISRSTLVFVILPVAYFAYLDRRRVLVGLSVIHALATFEVISLLRNVVYIGGMDQIAAQTSDGLIRGIRSVFSNQRGSFSFADGLATLINRVDSAQGIVLGSQFNCDAIGGIAASLQRFLYQDWVPVDADAYHLEWLGMALPPGFVAGGGFLSLSLSITKSQPHYIVLFAAIVAIILFLGEWLVRSVSRRYAAPQLYRITGIAFVLLFYVVPGTIVFWGYTAALVGLKLWPKGAAKWPESRVFAQQVSGCGEGSRVLS